MNSDLPKVLQPLAGLPMLLHLLHTLKGLDPACLHVVIGHGADQVRAALRHWPEARTVIQAERLGTGHAVIQAMDEIPDQARVLVLPGDMPLVRSPTLEAFTRLKAPLAVLSFVADDPDGYGRILRDRDRNVIGIREQRDAIRAERAITEVNSGVIATDAGPLAGWLSRLGNDNTQGEYYLTDCVALAVADGLEVQAMVCDDAGELMGANNMGQLADLEAVLQRRRREALMAAGVRMCDPASVQIRGDLRCGRDVALDIGVIVEGEVELGDGVVVGAGSVVRNCRLAAGTRIEPYCLLDGVETTGACVVGPFARLRPGTSLASGVRIGNFVETKNANFGADAKASHLSYVGDAAVGQRANLGAGTITCNYDGVNKHHTEIGSDAFIGSNSALVAPLRIGDRATIGAGSVVSSDAPEDALTVARARARTIRGWKRPTGKKS